LETPPCIPKTIVLYLKTNVLLAMNITAKNSVPQLDKAVQGFAKGAAGQYLMGVDRSKATFANMLQNKLFLVHAIRQGIPYSMFVLIKEQSPFDLSEWAVYLDLSEKSLQRYKADGRAFKPLQSEKILELAEVIQLGLEVFGDMESLKRWLDTPVFALGNHKPADLLKDSFGMELVVGELTRIEHGIFS
jgi:putative toxin-antitoxin system antitoxin component (TIGR02293 family)